MEAATVVALSDEEEIVLRQVHPSFLRDGRPSSQAWKPTKKDEGRLSVSRSSVSEPKAAFEHHTRAMQLASAGTWGVTVGECGTQELKVYPDPLPPTPLVPADPSHAFIDFTGLPNSRVEAKATKLGRYASERGALYLPEPPAASPER
jgi:hypothetical protein